MKLRKGILSLLVIALMLVTFGAITEVNATPAGPKYLGVEEYRLSSGLAYQANGKILWKITSYSNLSGSNPNQSTTMYCIKAGPGFGSRNMADGSFVGAKEVRAYEERFDLKDLSSISAPYNSVLPTGDNYNALVWVLEHCYIPELDTTKTYRAQLLSAAGIPESTNLTDDDIDAIQQRAIWYFTNNGEDPYNEETAEFAIKRKTGDANYVALSSIDDYRALDADELFGYFLDGWNNAGRPVAKKVDISIDPVSIDTTNAEIVLNGANYIVGPYTLNEVANASKNYTLTATLKNGTTPVDFSILDSSKHVTNIENVVGKQFYISVPKDSYSSGLTFNISAPTTEKMIYYWSVKAANAGAFAYDQPVVEVKQDTQPHDIPLIPPSVPEEKVFDLALRKFITSVAGVDMNIKVPVVDVSPLLNGQTTASYKHQKAPVSVSVGDEVIYTIRVYNEGEIDGYVTEITDHLPDWLEYVNDSFNTSRGWSAKDSRTVVATISGGKLLKAFNGTSLDYTDIQIKCKVKMTTEPGTVITNIADITGFTDKDGKPVTDRDSQKSNVVLPTSDRDWQDYVGKDGNNNTDLSNSERYWPGQQDDDDFDKLIVKPFDLALRKFIIKVNDRVLGTSTGVGSDDYKYDREPQITSTQIADLKNGATQTVEKTHTKTPVKVETGDTVTYIIRVYNEGEIDGKATEVTDILPAGLSFKEGSLVNSRNGWKNPSGDGKTIVSDGLKDHVLKAFDGTNIYYADLQIECVVTAEESSTRQSLKNVAEITKQTDKDGKEIKDRDSTPNNLTDDQKNNYNPGSSERGWGYEDDDDYEELVLPSKEFDLALRKFIIGVNDRTLGTTDASDKDGYKYDREPQITAAQLTKLKNGEVETVEKTHTKTPVRVSNGDTVLYIIRIYNEGDIDGKATAVTDYLPSGLTFKTDSSINNEYGWKNPSGDGKTIVTDKLKDTVLKAFDGTNIEYADLKIECIVTAEDGATSQSLKNVAEITTQTDKDGKTITDRDSQPGNLSQDQKSNYNPGSSERGWGYQDDDDYEELLLPAKEFDLSLRKFIIKVNNNDLKNDDGKYLKEPVVDVSPLLNGQTTASYKHQKAPVGVSIGNEVIYTIRVYNEGEINGYVTEITDHLPEQLEFVNDEFNSKYGWKVSADGRTIKTDITSPTTVSSASRDEIYSARTSEDDKVLLKAFDGTNLDYIDVQVKCRVKAVDNLDSVITNIADITGFTDTHHNTVTDRDSQEANVVLPSDSDLPDYKGNSSNKSELRDSTYHYKGQQDDDDFDKLILQEFDLALRKFITGVNDTPVTNRYPVFTTEKDSNGNYIYQHTKEPILVETTDLVEYTIRIFNEGDIAGYAKQVKDNIPDGLEFVPTEDTNKEYRWVMLDENGNETNDVKQAKYIVTDYLSKEQEDSTGRNNLITEFDQNTMSSPNYKDVKAVFKVIAPNSHEGIITNTAEISDDSDESGNPITDRDSTPNNNEFKEDDIDVEHIKLAYFDLALRKFITAVDNTAVTNRYPVFKITEDGKYIYEHTKEPVEVENGNIVTYTIRVYNEGTMAGYAKQVKDDLPEGLLYLPENGTNKEYRWIMLDENGQETTDVSKAVSIATDYLSKDQENASGRNNLLKPFNSGTMTEPDYRDLKIAFKVTEPNTSDRILINQAQISDDSDENGKPVIDRDSTPDKWIEGEDDQDIEKVKVKYFDLALRKWVTQAIVIENGKQKVTNTGHKAEDDPEQVVKVEIEKSKLSKVVVKFRYSIRITNEGEIAGYATEISDYIPSGLKFVAADNPDWKEADGKIITNKLADTLLQPGDSAEVEVLLTWINDANNMGLKVNVAEISEDKNDSNTPDIDSTPNNKVDGEDDIDDAPVILSTKTGGLTAIPYIAVTLGSLAIISAGVVLIKKYILR